MFVSVSYCHGTNHPKPWWLKTISTISHTSMGQVVLQTWDRLTLSSPGVCSSTWGQLADQLGAGGCRMVSAVTNCMGSMPFISSSSRLTQDRSHSGEVGVCVVGGGGRQGRERGTRGESREGKVRRRLRTGPLIPLPHPRGLPFSQPCQY